MKRLLYLFLLCSGTVMAQDDNLTTRIEAKFGVGEVKLKNFSIANNATTKVNSFSSYGINSVFAIDKNWGFELGVSYMPIKYTVTPATGLSQAPTAEEVNILSIPLKARFNLVDYIFINAGVLIDFEAKNTGYVVKQSGFGFSAGLGAKYDLPMGLGVFINPEINLRGLSRAKKNQLIPAINDTTVNFGLAYSF